MDAVTKDDLRELGDSLKRDLGDSLKRDLGDSLKRELGDSLKRDLGDSLKRDLGTLINDRFDALAVSVELVAVGVDRANKRLDEVQKLGPRFEDLHKTLGLVAEGQVALREQVERSMREMEARLDQRIANLEGAVRSHSSDIKRLTSEVAELRVRFDRREDLEALERRVSAVEKELAVRTR